ncbi:MAG: hypothetical protein IPM75_14700 [Candidatus Competibacteraceae bacterium]|nr:hypothetical protein [Candidatus Competibacteraceae bacterium]
MKLKIGWALAAGALLMNIGWNPAGSPRWSLLGGAAARAQVSVDFGFFHDELAPYGDWRQREPYGWVWFPDVGRSWRPYTFGYWVFTADYGWTWISTDPWGSIPFHYGRWFYDEGRRAWAWVPGTEWGRPGSAGAAAAVTSVGRRYRLRSSSMPRSISRPLIGISAAGGIPGLSCRQDGLSIKVWSGSSCRAPVMLR